MSGEKRRHRQWCYECQRYTLVRTYPTDLLEEWIDLCDPCASESGDDRGMRA